MKKRDVDAEKNIRSREKYSDDYYDDDFDEEYDDEYDEFDDYDDDEYDDYEDEAPKKADVADEEECFDDDVYDDVEPGQEAYNGDLTEVTINNQKEIIAIETESATPRAVDVPGDDSRDEYRDEYPEEYSDEYDDEYYEDDYDDEYYPGDERDDMAKRADDAYADDYDYNEYYEEDYRRDNGRRDKDSLGGKILSFVAGTTIVERIAAVFALIIVAGGIATASFYASAMSDNKQLESFEEVGASLAGIDVIGKSGLIAVADAEKARAMAATLVSDDEIAAEKPEEKEVPEASKEITVKMTLTSIKSDMKVKFINTQNDTLIGNVPFEIDVVNPDGSKVTYNDHDQDGIIYKKDITAGTYKITPRALPSEFSDYKLELSEKTLTVKDKVEMKAVDVSNEIKKESQVNVAAEDTAVKTVVESELQDTVEWVESTRTPIGADGSEYEYKSIDKKEIVDPTASSALTVGSYIRYAFAGNGNSSIENNKTGEDIEVEDENDDDDNTEDVKDDNEDEVTEEISVESDDDEKKEDDEKKDDDESTEVISTDEQIILEFEKVTLVVGQSVEVKAWKDSEKEKSLKFVLSTSDSDIADVSEKKIKARGQGTATITVSAEGYDDAKIEVTVLSEQGVLKDKDGNTVYIKNSDGKYVEATYAEYHKAHTFYVRKESTNYKYTGWQTIDGKTYYFNKNGDYVTGEQVIQGAKYKFGSDGVLSSSSGVLGIDVSKWNGNIDWNAVKKSGVNFAIIRCGYRGSSQGALIEDPMFRANINGATAAGIKVGVYFFTQAVNEVEAVEEASMVIKLVSGYNLAYPVFLDVEASNGRGDQISASQRTANIKAFCGTIQNAGFRAGVYANKTWYSSYMNVSQLTNYKIWLAQYAEAVTYNASRYDMWQYTSKGKIAGISGNVDLNISY